MPSYPMTPTPSRVPLKKPGLPPPMQSVQPGAMTSLGGQPTAPTPLQAPAPVGPSPTFQFAPPTLGAAPTAQPFAAFDPNSARVDQSALNFRLNAGQRVRERSAANRGTLLTGGLQAALEREAQGIASDENQKAYDRALASYNTNRGTAQQNFGNSLASFQADTGAALDASRLGLAGAQQTYGAQRDALGDARTDASTQAGVLNANSQARDLFEQQMAEYRAQVEAQKQAEMNRWNAETTRMQGTPPGTLGFAPRRRLPGQAGQGQ